MFKKLTLLAMSVAALVAFAVPVAAQANPIVTDSTGKAATTVTAVSENTKSTTTSGVLECTTVRLHLNLTQNDTVKAHGTGTGTANGNPRVVPKTHTNHCSSSTDATVNITAINVSTIELLPGGKGTATFSYTFDLAGAFHCKITGHASVAFTPTGGNTITINGGLAEPAAAFPCPKEGVIHGTFAVRDHLGEPVSFH